MTTRHRTSRISLALLFGLLLPCGVFPSRLAAQDSEISVTIQVAEQPGQVREISRVGQQGADFTVRPSVVTKNGTRPETLRLDLRCINNATGQVIPFCNVQLHWQVRPFTGGHNHDDGVRPRGDFEPSSGNTGSSGVLTTTYTAPQPSGIIDNILTGQLSNGQSVNAASFTIGVEVSGLVSLGAGPNYTLTGAKPIHPDNHYGTPTFNGMLRALADSYTQAFPGRFLVYNDISLIVGGVFDVQDPPHPWVPWNPPHAEHRYGQNCDVDLVPLQNRVRLKQLLIAGGFGPTYKEGDHWHVRE